MSESLAGVTFLAFGNGSPDVFSTYAAMSTHSGSLAIGELIGAAGFITAVVAGSMALVRPFRVARKSFVRDIGFFIVAASFSLVFLYDGKLTLWECAAMVAFYVFYVVFVVLWHWWRGRRRHRLEKEVAARGHFTGPGEETQIQAPYHDDPEDTPQRTPRISREPSADDFSALERGGSARIPGQENEEEEEEAETGRVLGELSNNMRLRRPNTVTRGRSGTLNPIRPSLVGALEFRSVLDSLQRSRNIQNLPINLRRYSDDPAMALNQQTDQLSTASGPAAAESYEVGRQSSKSVSVPQPTLEDFRGPSARGRAVSAAPAVNLSLGPNAREAATTPTLVSVPEIDLLSSTPERSSDLQSFAAAPTASQLSLSPIDRARSPSFSFSPPLSDHMGSRGSSPLRQPSRQPSPNHLAPEDAGNLERRVLNQPPMGCTSNDNDSLPDSPNSHARNLPKLDVSGLRTHSRQHSGASTPMSPFPTYTDAPRSQSPIGLSTLEYPTSASEDAYYPHSSFRDTPQERPLRWWPYSLLPSPGVLLSTLFPTLYCWQEKNIWEKCLGLVAAPSVFLLTVTLPVIDPSKDDDTEHAALPDMPNDDGATSIVPKDTQRPRNDLACESPLLQGNAETFPNPPIHHRSFGGHGDTATIAIETEARHQQHEHRSSSPPSLQPTNQKSPSLQLPQHQTSRGASTENGLSPGPGTLSSSPSSNRDWNRWLVIVQCFTAPFFIVSILWANGTFTPEDPSNPDASPSPGDLLKPSLISLLCSLVALTLLLLTTTPSMPPKWRPLLCFVGFAVSITWISTVAGEVVGVLKTLGVILNMSDAILGLTIFAVGNSLGDLVADVTVARLGYPVMALSACFGGPMLNILLGIGISGLAMMVRAADKRHHRHPQKEFKYKPYEIDVGGTLLISGVVLLVTLAGLLIAVPMNKWWMDRKIGWGLVALWVLGTTGNIVLEVTGFEVGWGSSGEA
ncbi:MAG: hypothetical protein Q9157_001105 [Trypethelium eluteriae]